MPDWSNEWATVKPGFYVRDVRSGSWLAGGWTDDQGRRRPLIAGVQHGAKRFEDRAGAARAAAYLGGEWEVVEHRAAG